MSDIENAKQLLSLAAEDVAAMEVLKDAEQVSSRIFGFHAQQAVEKALKAWLSLAGASYPLTRVCACSRVQSGLGPPLGTLHSLAPRVRGAKCRIRSDGRNAHRG